VDSGKASTPGAGFEIDGWQADF